MKIKSVVAIVCIWMCGTLSLSAAKPSAAERQQAAATMKALAEPGLHRADSPGFPAERGQRGYSFGYPQDQRE